MRNIASSSTKRFLPLYGWHLSINNQATQKYRGVEYIFFHFIVVDDIIDIVLPFVDVKKKLNLIGHDSQLPNVVYLAFNQNSEVNLKLF